MEALMKKRYEMVDLKGSNIFLKACNLSEWVCNFNTGNFFYVHEAMIEKFGVKPLFTMFQ